MVAFPAIIVANLSTRPGYFFSQIYGFVETLTCWIFFYITMIDFKCNEWTVAKEMNGYSGIMWYGRIHSIRDAKRHLRGLRRGEGGLRILLSISSRKLDEYRLVKKKDEIGSFLNKS